MVDYLFSFWVVTPIPDTHPKAALLRELPPPPSHTLVGSHPPCFTPPPLHLALICFSMTVVLQASVAFATRALARGSATTLSASMSSALLL